MATTQYVGARYVPLFKGEWDKTQTYEPLCIVQYQGNSYTSVQYVPTGVDIANEEYWALTGNYNAQVEQYRSDVKTLSEQAVKHFSNLKTLIQGNVVKDDIYFIEGRITKNIGSGFYKIVNNATPNNRDIVSCNNGLYAQLINTGIIEPEQLENENDSQDYSELIMYTIKYAKNNNLKMVATGSYITKNPIIFTYDDDYYNVHFDGTINYKGDNYAVNIKNKLSTYYFRKIIAQSGSGIAFDQSSNPFEYNVSNNFLEVGEITALNNGVAFIAGNHGVLDIDVQCDISIKAKNCYYSNGGNSNTQSAPSYASEFHIHGGRLYGSEFAINIDVNNGYECTGHSYSKLSAEGSNKLINLNAQNGTINTIHMDTIRIAEIQAPGMITVTGNVRECDFNFNHLFITTSLINNSTAYSTRGNFINAPINMPGSAYANYNCLYFYENGYKLLNQTGLYESNITSEYTWDLTSNTPPVNIININGTIDISSFSYISNGFPLYVNNKDKDVVITNGNNTIFNGAQMESKFYSIIKSNVGYSVIG